MQSLPTEAGPLSACSQCGSGLAPPSGPATFVYGVGTVGYQTCDACGAKWRYLWQDPPGSATVPNRLPLVLVGFVVIALLVVGAFAILRSPIKYVATETSATSPRPASSTGSTGATGSTGPTGPVASGADFQQTVGPTDTARASLLQYLGSTALSTPQFEVDGRVATFVQQAQQSVNTLANTNWPASASADVAKLVEVDQQFISDLDLIEYGLLYSESFNQKMTTDVANVRDHENAVRRDLGLSATS